VYDFTVGTHAFDELVLVWSRQSDESPAGFPKTRLTSLCAFSFEFSVLTPTRSCSPCCAPSREYIVSLLPHPSSASRASLTQPRPRLTYNLVSGPLGISFIRRLHCIHLKPRILFHVECQTFEHGTGSVLYLSCILSCTELACGRNDR
jgi:hypothetical protein